MAKDAPARSAVAQTSQTTIMDKDWCALTWGLWVPLERQAIIRTTPALPGVYRIRRKGGAGNCLVYIGQTGRTLRERLLSLAAGVNAESCPFNDPHTAAPHLWLLRLRDGIRLECSCATVAGDVQILRGTEDMLLWRHRIETGVSTEANYGRFYPGYTRPTNRWIVQDGRSRTRIRGRLAAPVAAGSVTIDFAISHPPLQGDAGPLQAPWWQRVLLSGARNLPVGPAVYVVYDQVAEAAVYIGETGRLRARGVAHASSPWPAREPWLAYLALPEGTPKHVLRELESDLLGWYFWRTGRAPTAQYLEQSPAGTSSRRRNSSF
jgi:hypothetical protein